MAKRAGWCGGLLLLLVTQLACSVLGGAAPRAPATVTKRVTNAGPAQSDRIAAVSRFFGAKLPSKIGDSQLHQLQLGDGELGPSDFVTHVSVSVDVADVPAWRAAGAPLSEPLPNDATGDAPAWWIGESAFKTCSQHSVNWFTANDGWMVVCDDGHIYVKTFTQ